MEKQNIVHKRLDEVERENAILKEAKRALENEHKAHLDHHEDHKEKSQQDSTILEFKIETLNHEKDHLRQGKLQSYISGH